MKDLFAKQSASLQKVHDISNAIRTLQLIVEELEDGYRFDDQDASENLRLFKSAVRILQEHFLQSREAD